MAATAQALIRFTTLLERPRTHPLTIPLLLAVLFAMPITPLAVTATRQEIGQGIASGTELLLYTAVRDEAGEPVTGLAADAFSATVGREAAVVEAVTEDATDEGVGYILLVDVSRSLTNRQFVPISQALTARVERMTPNDRATLVAFGEGVRWSTSPMIRQPYGQPSPNWDRPTTSPSSIRPWCVG